MIIFYFWVKKPTKIPRRTNLEFFDIFNECIWSHFLSIIKWTTMKTTLLLVSRITSFYSSSSFFFFLSFFSNRNTHEDCVIQKRDWLIFSNNIQQRLACTLWFRNTKKTTTTKNKKKWMRGYNIVRMGMITTNFFGMHTHARIHACMCTSWDWEKERKRRKRRLPNTGSTSITYVKRLRKWVNNKQKNKRWKVYKECMRVYMIY